MKVMCVSCVMQEKARAHQRKIEIVERSRQHTRHMYQQARANEMAMRTLVFFHLREVCFSLIDFLSDCCLILAHSD